MENVQLLKNTQQTERKRWCFNCRHCPIKSTGGGRGFGRCKDGNRDITSSSEAGRCSKYRYRMSP